MNLKRDIPVSKCACKFFNLHRYTAAGTAGAAASAVSSTVDQTVSTVTGAVSDAAAAATAAAGAAVNALEAVLPPEFASIVKQAEGDTDTALALAATVFAIPFALTLMGAVTRGYAGEKRPFVVDEELRTDSRAFLVDTRSEVGLVALFTTLFWGGTFHTVILP